jgi:mannosyltransferase
MDDDLRAEATPIERATPERERRTGIALAAILLVAVVVRVHALDRHSFWYDEVVTMTVARQPGPSAVLDTLQRIDSTRAPLHPLLLEGWIAVFGSSDVAARSLSAWLGVLTVILVYWIGRQAYGPSAALWGAALAALSPLGVQYSQEVRMYALLTTITCLCWGLLFSFRRSATAWQQAAFAASLTALVYCHPLGGLMVVALAMAYLIDRPSSRLGPGSWLLIHLAMTLALAPWVVHYLDHPPDPKPMAPGRLLNWPRFFIGGHSSTLAVCGSLIAWGFLDVRRRGLAGRSETRASLMVLVWFLVPPALLYAYSRVSHPIFGPMRYVTFVAPGYLLLVARGLVALPPCARCGVALFGLLATIPALEGRVYCPETKPDWRTAASIVRRVDPGAPVILFCREPHMYPRTIPYYLDPGTRVITVEREAQELAGGKQAPTANAWFMVDPFDGAIVKETPEPLKSLYIPVRSWTLDRVRVGYFRLRDSGDRTRSRRP